MKRYGILLLFSMGLVAANWTAKDFKDWTEKDARALLTDSPWAKQIPMPANGRPDILVMEPGANGAPPPSASLGNPSNTTTGTNMTVSANPGSAGPADPNGLHTLPTTSTPSAVSGNSGAPPFPQFITIIWASAVPVRLAVLKLRSGAKTPTDSEVADAMKIRAHYTIAVFGLPAPAEGLDVQGLATLAALKVSGKMPITATKSEYRKVGRQDVYLFQFPKTAAISTMDQQVEFKLRLDHTDLKKKFDLEAMRYHGEIAL